MDNSDLAKRMKQYEAVSKSVLINRTPVIIRIDGRSFHTWTKNFKRPFDEILIKSMQETMKYLCENIQGCVLGYTQSDEITLVLVDYKNLNSSAWFDNKVQKMCSIAASMATMAFNRIFLNNVIHIDPMIQFFEEDIDNEDLKYIEYLSNEYGLSQEYLNSVDHNTMIIYSKAIEKGAMFDARVFNLPKEEVTNNIYWRQLDASRNSIQMVGQAYFSHNDLQEKNCSQIQDMLMIQKGINWNDFPTYQKRGSCCIKNVKQHKLTHGEEIEYLLFENHPENQWVIDKDIPIFKGDGREYIERLIFLDSK